MEERKYGRTVYLIKFLLNFLFFIFAFNLYSNNKLIEKSKNVDSKISENKVVLANEITALIFTAQPQIIESEDLKDYSGIEIEGLPIKCIETFKQYFNAFLKKPLTFKILRNIKLCTLSYFKTHTNYLVDVKILENQDVTLGKVQIFVQIPKVCKITASGAKYFSNSKIAKGLNICSNDCVDIKKIRKYSAFLNKNPFRQVSTILEPSDACGYTNIHFCTKDIFPIKIFGGYENTPNIITSNSRFLVGLNFGNFLYLAHILNIEFKTAPSVDKWWAVTGDYLFPTISDNYFKIIGSYVQTKPQTEKNYDLKGKAWSILLRYHIPFEIYSKRTFSQGTNEIILGYDFKRTNNFLIFFKEAVYNKFIDVSQFVLQFNGTAYDRYGITSYLLSLYLAPGDMTKHNDSKDFEIERNAKKSTYSYCTFHFDRTFNLKRDFLYVMDFFAQVSSTKLLPTEQMSLGGYSTIRGYQENKAFGDKGFYLKNEIRTPKIDFKKVTNCKHQLQFLSFLDFGYVADINKNITQKKSTILSSIGPGLRYTTADKLIVKLDYGIQLKNFHRDFFNKSFHSKIHLFVTMQY